MIYYSYVPKDFTKHVMGMMTNEYDLVAKKFILNMNTDEASRMISKWIERYHLLETAQQTYRRRLNSEPVFSLLVHFTYSYLPGLSESECWEKFDKNEPAFLVQVEAYLFCRTSDAFLLDEKTQKVLSKTDKQDLLKINRKIFEICPSSESFSYIGEVNPISCGRYELVRLTKPKKSIKELQAKNWTNEKHVTDWTWRLTDNASLDEKKAYFERHFRALEGYLGYRGVRQQIGNLYHLEKRLFKDKYNQPWFDHGARTLKLSYMKKLKSPIVNNSSYQEAEAHFRSVLTEDLNKKYEKWKAKSNKTEV